MAGKSTAKPSRPAVAAHDHRGSGAACVHNLKNVSLELPRDRLIVVTGLSWLPGKSLGVRHHLRRGTRRAGMESLSSYSKRFVAQVAKPDVDFVFGLSPGDLDRTKDDRQQSALDRRHHDRYRQLLRIFYSPPLSANRIARGPTSQPPAGRRRARSSSACLSLPAGTEIEACGPWFSRCMAKSWTSSSPRSARRAAGA